MVVQVNKKGVVDLLTHHRGIGVEARPTKNITDAKTGEGKMIRRQKMQSKCKEIKTEVLPPSTNASVPGELPM